MGNRVICMKKKDVAIRTGGGGGDGSRSKRVSRSQRKLLGDEEMLHRRALSMAIHQAQLSQRFDGSVSRRFGSTSSRRQTLSDPFSNNKQVISSNFIIMIKKFRLWTSFLMFVDVKHIRDMGCVREDSYMVS